MKAWTNLEITLVPYVRDSLTAVFIIARNIVRNLLVPLNWCVLILISDTCLSVYLLVRACPQNRIAYNIGMLVPKR